jgi:hypothetical protein
MTSEVMSADRARGIRRMLLVSFGLAGILVILAIPLVLGDYQIYGLIVLGVGLVIGASSFVANKLLGEGRPEARKWAYRTGALLCILSIPLMPIWIGLITVIAGIGLLVVVFAPDKEQE